MTTVPPADPEGLKPLRVRRGRVDSVDLYEIKDVELDTLERGSPADLQLNFAIFLISLAFGALASLVTATFRYDVVRIVFVVIVVVGFILGAYLLISWNRSRRSVKELCIRIRRRIPPDVAPPTPRTGSGDTESVQPAGD